MPALAKAGANYMNSQLIRMEAEANGYDEGIGARRQRPGQRGLRREHLRGPQRRPLHAAAGQLGPLRHHPRLGADHRPPSGLARSSSRPCRANCSTSPTKSSSPARLRKSRPSAPSTASSSATASRAKSPRRSPTSSSASPTASSPTASAGSPRSRSMLPNPSPRKQIFLQSGPPQAARFLSGRFRCRRGLSWISIKSESCVNNYLSSH